MRRLFGTSVAAVAQARFYTRAAPNSSTYSGVPESLHRANFEISEVSDDPAKGFMLRVSYEDKRVSFSVFPQLGPRKVDPMDPAPQFDFDGRRLIRFFPDEVAGVLTVCEGMTAHHRISNRFHDVVFEKLPSNTYQLSGTISKHSTPLALNLKFEGYRATMLTHFLNDALCDGFGFYRLQQQQYQRVNSNNNQDRRRSGGQQNAK